jgi:ankyrin repeat protein
LPPWPAGKPRAESQVFDALPRVARGSAWWELMMPRTLISFLAAALLTSPAAMAAGAPATQSNASADHGDASLSQDRIKELFFDAARQGRDDLVSGLIRSGMKPDERDARGYTPLIIAAYNGQAKTVDVLVSMGADPCATDSKGNSSLMGVAFKGDAAITQRLIVAHCDVNARNEVGQTALMMAALFGQTDVVKLLIANGADRSLQDRSGNTASSLAQQQGNPQIVALLARPAGGP